MQHGMFSTAVNAIELSVTLLSFKLTMLILILVLFVCIEGLSWYVVLLHPVLTD